MKPKGWITQFNKLCRSQFGVSAPLIVSTRDIIASYEAGDTPEQLLKKVLRSEVSKSVPISPPTGKPRPVRPIPPRPTPALDSTSTEYELTSPELPGSVTVMTSPDKIEQLADLCSNNPLIKSFKIEEVTK